NLVRETARQRDPEVQDANLRPGGAVTRGFLFDALAKYGIMKFQKVKIFSALVLGFSALLAHGKDDRPNIVVFLADDMGWGDSGTYGHELIRSPNLDKLASQGVKFTQFYSAAGVCSPSRSAILTGRTP